MYFEPKEKVVPKEMPIHAIFNIPHINKLWELCRLYRISEFRFLQDSKQFLIDKILEFQKELEPKDSILASPSNSYYENISISFLVDTYIALLKIKMINEILKTNVSVTISKEGKLI